MGLQRAQEEIRGEVTGIRDQLATLIQMMQGNNLQPQHAQVHRAPRHEIEETEDNQMEDEEAEERGRPRRQRGDPTSGIKLNIPPFRGTSSPEEYLEWVQKVEKVFDWHEYPKAKKCKAVALEFTDYALLWWENLKAQRRRDGDDEVTTWLVMKRLMKKRFVPDYYKQELYIKLQTLRQGSLSVEEYVKEFELLMIRCDLNEPQEQTVARFLGGLKKDIANVVELQLYIFLEDVIKLAIKVERQQKRGGIRMEAATSSTKRVVSTPSRAWNAPKQDGKMETSRGSTSSDSLKGKEKASEPQFSKRSRDRRVILPPNVQIGG